MLDTVVANSSVPMNTGTPDIETVVPDVVFATTSLPQMNGETADYTENYAIFLLNPDVLSANYTLENEI